MAPFQFRLKALLAIREASRDDARMGLAQAQAEELKLHERRASLERELAHQQQQIRDKSSPGRVNVEHLANLERFERVLRREVGVLVDQETAMAAEVESRREALVAANREVRVLENLSSRRLEQFRQREAQAEVKQLDEVAGQVTRQSRG